MEQGNEDLKQEIMSMPQACRLEFYGSKRCEVIWEEPNVCVKEDDLLTTRWNTLIFIHDQSVSEKQKTNGVKLVDGVSKTVNLPSC